MENKYTIKCEECGVTFSFNNKDIIKQKETIERYDHSDTKILKKRKTAGLFSSGSGPQIKETSYFNITNSIKKSIKCPICGSMIHLTTEDKAIIDTKVKESILELPEYY